MAVPQGTFAYPGIVGVLSASYTLRRGISPGVAHVSIPPPTALLPRGTMTWAWNGDSVSFPNCCVESVHVTRPGGHTVWNVSIVDRRWAWKFGAISGEYNIKRKNTVVPDREKTPRELATLCLQAMGETGFDVSLLPNDTRPYVEWKLVNPARALADLAESLGCIVVLRLDNTVKLELVGVGAAIPIGYLFADEEFGRSMTPPSLVFNSAPTRWQVDLELEPVAKEADGTIVPIDSASYKPTAGWETEDPVDFYGVAAKADRKLAKEWIWRRYRVKLTTPLSLGGVADPVTELARILPLVDEQVETEGEGEAETPKAPIVWGRFSDGHGADIVNVDAVAADTPETNEDLIYEGNFSIDVETGIVEFSDPVYVANDSSGTSLGYTPAEIKLRCSVTLKDATSRALVRAEKQIAGDASSFAPPLYIVRDDVEHLLTYSGGSWTDNITEVETEANYYLSEAYRNFIPEASANAEYAGFLGLNPDGAIATVSYSIRNGEAKTKVSRNLERDSLAPSYAERREREKLRTALKDRERDALAMKRLTRRWRR